MNLRPRRRRPASAAGPRAWQLLDQSGLKAIGAAGATAVELPASRQTRKVAKGARRSTSLVLRVAMLALGVVTVFGLAVGLLHAFSGEIGASTLIRLALLVLVAAGLLGQAKSLLGLIPGVRSLRLRRRKHAEASPWRPLLLDQSGVRAIGQSAASVAPVVAPRRRGRRAAGAATWYPLAVGSVALLLVAVVGSLARLVWLAIERDLLSVTGAMTAGITAMLGVGLWGSAAMAVRSMEQSRLRRRKRAIRQLLRALLRWLGGGSSGRAAASSGAIAGPQVVGVCVLAILAVAAGLSPVLAGDGDDGGVDAVSASEDPDGTTQQSSGQPAAATTPGVATSTATAASGSSNNQATASPSPMSTATATAVGQPGGGGNGAATATSRPSSTATPTPTSLPLAVATPTNTATATPTATPTPTPTPIPPTPIPPTPTQIPPTPTPIPPTPTQKPTATPTQTCLTPQDCDGDGVLNTVEIFRGSDPYNPLSKPEHLLYMTVTCTDGQDNDKDGKIDFQDSGCQ